jgi:hypothetical protein
MPPPGEHQRAIFRIACSSCSPSDSDSDPPFSFSEFDFFPIRDSDSDTGILISILSGFLI